MGPQNTGPSLRIIKANRRDTWNVNPRVCVAQIPGQTHISGRDIDVRRASTLDFWTMDATGQRPLHIDSMELLEGCVAMIQNTVFVGDNPVDYR